MAAKVQKIDKVSKAKRYFRYKSCTTCFSLSVDFVFVSFGFFLKKQ